MFNRRKTIVQPRPDLSADYELGVRKREMTLQHHIDSGAPDYIIRNARIELNCARQAWREEILRVAIAAAKK